MMVNTISAILFFSCGSSYFSLLFLVNPISSLKLFGMVEALEIVFTKERAILGLSATGHALAEVNPEIVAPSFSAIDSPTGCHLSFSTCSTGFYVVAPDFFYGEPYDPNNPDRPLSVWIKDHGPDKGYEDAKLVIDALKSKGVSSIGAAGFCWGAKVVARLAKDPLIQAAVMLHPSFVNVDDIKSVKVPIAILGAEQDHISPPELLKQFDEILKASEVDSFVKIFPKVGHGWSVRYDFNDPTAMSSANEAQQDMLAWFAKYVK